jgi:hypothetical protein
MKKLFLILMALSLVPLGCTDYAGITDAGPDADAGGGDPGGDPGGGDKGGGDKGGGDEGGGDKGGDWGGGDKGGGDKDPWLEPECTTPEDCTLYSDCCSCLALAPGEEPPRCDIPECFIDHCTSIGIDYNSAPLCVTGRCIIGFDCDHTQVFCDGPTPVCDPGEIPRVQDGCWRGDCVPTSECAFVPGCIDCDPSHYVCVRNVAHLPSHHCVDPGVCIDKISCDCLGKSVCVHPFYACGESAEPNQIDCNCPICR